MFVTVLWIIFCSPTQAQNTGYHSTNIKATAKLIFFFFFFISF